jgi:type I restriction enzyme, S subunit
MSGAVQWRNENTIFLPIEYKNDFKNYILLGGELLMNLTAQSLKDEFLGRVCLKKDSEPALLNQRICAFYPKGNHDIRPYLFLYFKSPKFRAYVDTLDSGTLIKHMHSKQLIAHQFPLPPIAEQQEIVRRIEALFAKADRIEAQYKTARQQVDRVTPALLAKAFRGELVPQDPNDEPASVLLERVKEGRSATQPEKAKRGKKTIK